jgi:hypothetical protein
MTSNPVQVFIATFETENEAGDALRDFRRWTARDRSG